MADIPKVESEWTEDGFNEVFEHFMKRDITYTEAYRLTEEEHVRLFNKLRYKSYDSFRGARHKRLFK